MNSEVEARAGNRKVFQAPKNPQSSRRGSHAFRTFRHKLRTPFQASSRGGLLWGNGSGEVVPQLKPWQKECKKVWDKLVKSDFDWAHLAMHLWAERVVTKCVKDRSLAIYHGLYEALWREGDDGKWGPRDVSDSEREELIRERTSPP